jgi:hypothetical protein
MRRPTWGDSVNISEKAPPQWRPGAYASVCGITVIENERMASLYECPIGTTVYLVEFADGSAVEVPEDSIEEDPQYPWQA